MCYLKKKRYMLNSCYRSRSYEKEHEKDFDRTKDREMEKEKERDRRRKGLPPLKRNHLAG